MIRNKITTHDLTVTRTERGVTITFRTDTADDCFEGDLSYDADIGGDQDTGPILVGYEHNLPLPIQWLAGAYLITHSDDETFRVTIVPIPADYQETGWMRV